MKDTNNPRIYFYLLKRFFNYYRLPLSIVNEKGESLYCFPAEVKNYILPKSIIEEEINRYHQSSIDYYTPFLAHTPYNSFISIIPLQTDGYLFVGPSFSRPFSANRASGFTKFGLSKKDLNRIHNITKSLPLVDEAYLTDAISLLVLLIHYKEVTPQEILDANNLTISQKSVFETSHIIDGEYEDTLLFEKQLEDAIEEGNDTWLTGLWQNFSSSVKEDFLEYMYSEHHLMIPLLSSARQAALKGGASQMDVIALFHSTISQISSRGSLSVNLKTVERATFELCNLVKRNKTIPYRADLCVRCEEYIDEHLGSKITASDIANYCKIDRSMVFDIFRKNYNMSLTEYITNTKMNRAKTILHHSNIPISEISSTLGYCSSSYFSKTFYTHFKCTPTEYRKKKTQE
ncbi:MAG: AraC family transcriptional regulator [Lachnospiraceae bacterium]|nr:AraC family transcriptional regulator [Lachnospiraceae bacterium]